MDLFMGSRQVRTGYPPVADERPPQRESTGESYSLQQESYQEELAFDKKRTRRRKLGGVVRAVGLVIGVPILLVVVFFASYILTCIINGATPDEVIELVGSLIERLQGFAWQLMGT